MKKNKKGYGFVSNIIIIIALVVLAFSLYNVKKILDDYKTSEISYQEAKNFVKEAPAETEAPEEEEEVERVIDFASLQKINPDVIGWIYLPDSNIDYPLLKSADNADYIHTTYDGQYASAGSIFMDCRNDSFNDYNTIIYGHNMKNGSMFHDLKKYTEKEWYDSHNIFEIYTPEGMKKYKVIAVCMTDAYSDYYKVNFTGLDDYENWLKEGTKKSLYTEMYDIHKGTVTLSTCRGATGSTERLVVLLQEI